MTYTHELELANMRDPANAPRLKLLALVSSQRLAEELLVSIYIYIYLHDIHSRARARQHARPRQRATAQASRVSLITAPGRGATGESFSWVTT